MSKIGSLSTTWARALGEREAWPWEAERSKATATAAWGAIFNALRWTVPDAEHACVVERTDAPPAVYALAGSALFRVECVAVGTPVHEAEAHVTRFHLDPSEIPVEARTSIPNHSGSQRGTIDWTFQLRPDQPLELRTVFDSDNEPGQDHLFAGALARKLAWQVPLESDGD